MAWPTKIVPGETNAAFDDIPDRLVGHTTDGRKKFPPLAHAAAGINDRDAVIANHKADIGDRAFVLLGHQRDRAEMRVIAVRDFDNRQWVDEFSRMGQRYCPDQGRGDDQKSERGRLRRSTG